MTEYLVGSKDERGVVTLTLNRPDVHNAFDDQLIASLLTSLNKVESDSTCRALVLRSEGKSFSAGADLGWMKRMASASPDVNLDDARALGRMLNKLDGLRVPTIARIQGAALGGAVGLVACCDIAVASTRATFALSEVRLGLVPATISPYVIATIGSRQARRLFLTAERIDARHAQRIGLVNEVTEPEGLDESVLGVLDNVLGGGPQAQALAKQLIRDVAGAAIDDALVEETSQRIADIRCGAEGREGVSAFLERRKPRWVGGAGS